MYFMLAILSKNKTKLVLLTQTVRFCSVNLTCYRGLAKDGTRGDSALEKNKRARQELKSQARREITTSKQTVSKCNVKIMVKSSFFFLSRVIDYCFQCPLVGAVPFSWLVD